MYSGKYLWIYGRKNMKLFSGNYKGFFNYLIEKITCNPQMSGIDFRCLFLDPRSDEVARAHSQQRIFKSELENTLIRAKDVVRNNSVLEKCLKLYENKREEIIIRLDNCIIYSKPIFDSKDTGFISEFSDWLESLNKTGYIHKPFEFSQPFKRYNGE